MDATPTVPKGIAIRAEADGQRRAVGRCPFHGRLSRPWEFELAAGEHWVCPECDAIIRFDGARVHVTDAQGQAVPRS
jgi:hypothetical protein